MYTLTEALTRKGVEPAIVMPVLQRSGTFNVPGEFFRNGFDFLNNVDYKKLKLDPEALMIEYDLGFHPMRIFATLLPPNILSIN